MPDPLRPRRGFSLPEVMMAMLLTVVAVTALAGYYRGLAVGFVRLNHYRQLWRCAWAQTQPLAPPMPEGWQVRRAQTAAGKCVSISASVAAPDGGRASMSRLHCPLNQ